MSTFTSHDSTVNAFYLAFYGRPADPVGLAFWSKQLAANNGELGGITQAFATSEEAQVRFGTDSVSERVAEIYQQLFNRAPEATGLAYWTGVVEQGHASMADVAVAIQQGAQGTDASLSALRQQAADAFTATVEAGGTQYSGYASIEAARILVRAVTPDATASDLDALVKAAVSFADTATRTPQVVDAIAVNTTLLALFDTARGKSEPVGLAQALADTAKAAAGDPVTLESLLRGGGMDKVLKVMPANATLKDVVDALAKGGLPAAVEVVYPTAPGTPAPAYSLSFKSVDQGEGDTVVDHVTRKDIVDVTFGYRGNDLNAGQKYEFRINGGEWSDKGYVVDTNANTVVLKGIDLSQGEGMMGPQSIGIMGEGPIPDLLSNIELRAVRGDGSTIAVAKQVIVYDHYAARPFVSVATSEAGQVFDGGNFTNIPQITVEGIEPGAKVEYRLVEKYYERNAEPQQTEWSETMPELTYDNEYTVQLRQTDVSGNVSGVREITFTLDREAPNTPTISLNKDSGTPGDGITNVNDIAIDNLEISNSSAWQYRIDSGEWTFGKLNDETGKAVLTLDGAADGIVDVQVRQFDAAGNIGKETETLSFTLDTTAPAGTFSLDGVEGSIKGNTNVTGLAQADVHFAFDGVPEAGDTFEFKLDNGQWQALGGNAFDTKTGILTVGDVDLATRDRDVTVRVVDAAGNATTSKTALIDSTVNDVPPVLITKVAPLFATNAAKLTLGTSLDALASVDATKLSLDIMSTGSATLTQNYFDGKAFNLTGNTLTLDATPGLNLYQLGWADGAFTTNKGDAVAAGSNLFVGGTIATVALSGFEIESMEHVTTLGINHSNDKKVNTAFIGQADVDARIHSGDGNDLIADNGSALTLVYDKLSMSTYDVVLGFDTAMGSNASDADKVEIAGTTAIRFDDNRDGELQWGIASSDKYLPAPGIEAVHLSGMGSQSFNALLAGDTLKALNASLNVSGFAIDDDLLILATYDDQSIILSYVEKTGNGKIDQADLAFIAVFDQGVVNTVDIELVGSALPTPP